MMKNDVKSRQVIKLIISVAECKAECKGVFLALQNQMAELTDVTPSSKCLLYTFLIILVSDNLLASEPRL